MQYKKLIFSLFIVGLLGFGIYQTNEQYRSIASNNITDESFSPPKAFVSFEEYKDLLKDVIKRIPDLQATWNYKSTNQIDDLTLGGGVLRGAIVWLHHHLESKSPAQIKETEVPRVKDILLAKEGIDFDIFAPKDHHTKLTTLLPVSNFQDILDLDFMDKVKKAGGMTLEKVQISPDEILDFENAIHDIYEGRLSFLPRAQQGYDEAFFGKGNPITLAIRYLRIAVDMKDLAMPTDKSWEVIQKLHLSNEIFVNNYKSLDYSQNQTTFRLKKQLKKLYQSSGKDLEAVLGLLKKANILQILGEHNISIPKVSWENTRSLIQKLREMGFSDQELTNVRNMIVWTKDEAIDFQTTLIQMSKSHREFSQIVKQDIKEILAEDDIYHLVSNNIKKYIELGPSKDSLEGLFESCNFSEQKRIRFSLQLVQALDQPEATLLGYLRKAPLFSGTQVSDDILLKQAREVPPALVGHIASEHSPILKALKEGEYSQEAYTRALASLTDNISDKNLYSNFRLAEDLLESSSLAEKKKSQYFSVFSNFFVENYRHIIDTYEEADEKIAYLVKGLIHHSDSKINLMDSIAKLLHETHYWFTADHLPFVALLEEAESLTPNQRSRILGPLRENFKRFIESIDPLDQLKSQKRKVQFEKTFRTMMDLTPPSKRLTFLKKLIQDDIDQDSYSVIWGTDENFYYETIKKEARSFSDEEYEKIMNKYVKALKQYIFEEPSIELSELPDFKATIVELMDITPTQKRDQMIDQIVRFLKKSSSDGGVTDNFINALYIESGLASRVLPAVRLDNLSCNQLIAPFIR